MIRYAYILGALGAWSAAPAMAQTLDLSLPNTAEQTFRTVQDPGAYALPTGPWRDGVLPTTRVEGRIEVESWRIANSGLTSFQLARPLRDALAEAGFEIVLDCADQACGGFDFRFATLVLPAPEMYVSLDDYHVIAAQSPGKGAVSILASKGLTDAYVQIIRAGGGVRAAIRADAVAPLPAEARGVSETLEAEGHVVLSDLVFRPGSTALGEGRVASLDALAAYLASNPTRRILFVGHTDATGSLAANRSVSQRRADAAVTYLRTRHDTPAAQIGAEGAGYLAPVGSNLTDAGRKANRRVEAVLISTE